MQFLSKTILKNCSFLLKYPIIAVLASGEIQNFQISPKKSFITSTTVVGLIRRKLLLIFCFRFQHIKLTFYHFSIFNTDCFLEKIRKNLQLCLKFLKYLLNGVVFTSISLSSNRALTGSKEKWLAYKNQRRNMQIKVRTYFTKLGCQI